MNTSTLLDNNQKEVYKKMPESNMLSNIAKDFLSGTRISVGICTGSYKCTSVYPCICTKL